ncbi:hypothetical protein EXE41_01195 [Halorubrum sp. SD690R]|nr:hypothetical protein EXE41_01195 [Halorubrum sp. SD690R]
MWQRGSSELKRFRSGGPSQRRTNTRHSGVTSEGTLPSLRKNTRHGGGGDDRDGAAIDLQLAYRGDTFHQAAAALLDQHPWNVFDHRIAQLVDVVDALTWSDGRPAVPGDTLG